MSEAFVLLLQILVIIVLARSLGGLFRFIGQPRVIGEVVAGILLGPSFLGWVAPGVSAILFPLASIPYLKTLSELGLVLFMFLVGLSINPKHLNDYGHAAVLTSHVSMIVPFALGATMALFIYPLFAGAGGFTVFALFMGSAMSTTAFPVLARILKEQNLMHSKVGTVAIACAAVDDVTGWCILAYLTILIHNGRMLPWLTLSGSLAFIAFMFFIVKPFLRRYERRMISSNGGVDEIAILSSIFLLLGSALITEMLGIHLLFGSFVAGMVTPRNARLIADLHAKLESITLLLLLPLFFAFTGLRTSIRLVDRSEMWLVCAAIIAVAVIGKAGASTVAARVAGLSWRDAGIIGALLNTRGLMELVVLNIGLDLHVITPGLFAIMVLMAVVTTLMTAPLLRWIALTRSAKVSVCNLSEIREVV
jgi:Kef-type K+ transport system membrane component KefB